MFTKSERWSDGPNKPRLVVHLVERAVSRTRSDKACLRRFSLGFFPLLPSKDEPALQGMSVGKGGCTTKQSRQAGPVRQPDSELQLH